MRPALSSRTTAAAVIGSPVAHSLSPVVHNAAFEATGLDWVYLGFEVPRGGGEGALDAMRALGLGGLSVTMPLKAEAARAVDDLTEEARALDSVNCVVPSGGRLRGHSTDGAGFVDALRADGVAIEGGRFAIIGAGGAARAVIDALARSGAARVSVVNRNRERAEAAARLAPGVGEIADLDVVDGADVIVNATPMGMSGTGLEDQCPAPVERLGPGQIVVDLVYEPAETEFLRAAEGLGVRCIGGLGMLVHQAAHAFTLWTGVGAPVEVMRAAAEASLRRSPVAEAM